MDANVNVLNWFELPVTNMERAKKFYDTIFEISVEVQQMGPLLMGMFPSENGNGKLSGALVFHEQWYKPSMEGVLIYFNANPAMDGVLSRVEAAGGKIIQPKTQISPEIGYMAMLIDSEGNRVALHSQN